MERPRQPDPERQSPEVIYRIMGVEAVFHYYNTDVFTFEGADCQLDYIHYHPTEATNDGVLIFDRKKVDELTSLQFPNHHLPWASDGQREAFVKYQISTLEHDLKQHGGSA